MIRVREVTEPEDPVIERFGRLQREVYFDPGSLIPSRFFGPMLTQANGPRRNYFLVAEEDGSLLGGTVFHFLRAAGTGFSSFMGVLQPARGRGIARMLHEARLEVLQRAAGGGG